MSYKAELERKSYFEEREMEGVVFNFTVYDEDEEHEVEVYVGVFLGEEEDVESVVPFVSVVWDGSLDYEEYGNSLKKREMDVLMRDFLKRYPEFVGYKDIIARALYSYAR